MQYTITTVTALFAATACALPAPQGSSASAKATVSFANDQSGANAPVTAPLNGSVINLSKALAGSPIGRQNQVVASSAQLVAFPQNVACTITNSGGYPIGQLTAQKTFVRLQAGGINLKDATLKCTGQLKSRSAIMDPLDSYTWPNPNGMASVDGDSGSSNYVVPNTGLPDSAPSDTVADGDNGYFNIPVSDNWDSYASPDIIPDDEKYSSPDILTS